MQRFIETIIEQSDLPVARQYPQIVTALEQQKQCIIEAEPGAGKTTLIPLIILQQLIGRSPTQQTCDDKIIMLEPRRLAARNAAVRMAELLGESVGDTIGYRIRQETRLSQRTRVEVVTEGVLVRMIQQDPELSGYAAVIFDEFHERSIHTDLSLALCLDSAQSLRDDLLIVVMSATLAIDALKPLMPEASLISVEGRSYPVELTYLAPRPGEDWRSVLLLAVNKALSETPGDLLIFVAGIGEIRWCEQQLKDATERDALEKGREHSIDVCSLHGGLPFAAQKQAIFPRKHRRKIIVTTNIAETSLTIEGVTAVIDTGEFREAEFDAQSGFDRLQLKRVSVAQATQRAGRAGRQQAGRCYRLWSESQSLRDQPRAEITRVELTGFALDIKHWGAAEPTQLPLIEAPPAGHWQQALSLLQRLELLDSKLHMTAKGRRAAELALHPRYAHLLLSASAPSQQALACWLVALLEEKDIWRGDQAKDPDILARLEALADQPNMQGGVFQRQASRWWQWIISNQKGQGRGAESASSGLIPLSRLMKKTEAINWVIALLFAAFPERLARRQGRNWLLASGQRLTIADSFSQHDWALVIKIGGQAQRSRAFWTIALSESEVIQLLAGKTESVDNLSWDKSEEKVLAYRELRYGQIALKREPIPKLSNQQMSQCLLAGLIDKGLEQLAWWSDDLQLMRRVELIRQQGLIKSGKLREADCALPAMDWQSLQSECEQWLLPFLSDCRSLADVTPEILHKALISLLDWSQQKIVDELAPQRWPAPSGRQPKLEYCPDQSVVAAIKLQEVFGLTEQPKVLNGQIVITFHLLSPAARPLQVTQDIASFWQNVYPQVKKEMKGRYPRHPWPDDPLQAHATALTKKALAKKSES